MPSDILIPLGRTITAGSHLLPVHNGCTPSLISRVLCSSENKKEKWVPETPLPKDSFLAHGDRPQRTPPFAKSEQQPLALETAGQRAHGREAVTCSA